jgi:hypothetical protein
VIFVISACVHCLQTLVSSANASDGILATLGTNMTAFIIAYIMSSKNSWKTSVAIVIVGLELALVSKLLSFELMFKVACLCSILGLRDQLSLPSIDAYILTIIMDIASNVVLLNSNPLAGGAPVTHTDLHMSAINAAYDGNGDGNGHSHVTMKHLSHAYEDVTVCANVCLRVVACGMLYVLIFPQVWSLCYTVFVQLKLSKKLILYSQLAVLLGSLLLLRYQMYVVLGMDPLQWMFVLLVSNNFKRLYVCGYWIACLFIAIPFSSRLTILKWPNICVRKVFHVLVAVMFNLPLLDESLLSFNVVAMGVSMCALLLIECCRSKSCEILRETFPVLDSILGYFQTFVDKRDENKAIVLSHIYLLFACALPVWFWGLLHDCHSSMPSTTTSAHSRSYGYSSSVHLHSKDVFSSANDWPLMRLLPHVGYVTVGLGDAAVSWWRYCEHMCPIHELTWV